MNEPVTGEGDKGPKGRLHRVLEELLKSHRHASTKQTFKNFIAALSSENTIKI